MQMGRFSVNGDGGFDFDNSKYGQGTSHPLQGFPGLSVNATSTVELVDQDIGNGDKISNKMARAAPGTH